MPRHTQPLVALAAFAGHVFAANMGKGSLAGHSYPAHTEYGILDLAQAQIVQDPFPFHFPELDSSPHRLFAMPDCQQVKIEDATIDQLQEYLQDGSLTSVQLLDCYIERSFQTGEYINSVLQINPDARCIAATLDQERKKGHVRGPLHGIPFLVKDNFASKDKMQTTAGSWALQGSIVPRDAFAVKKMREAGAVLMGKATMSEWADMRSTNYSEGYSARGGQGRSSFNFNSNPGGSSTGSALAVANNVVPISLGTETDGSVINPAERGAIVGIKPTVGLTSRDGVIPESIHQDSVGAFGKTVRDAVYVLDATYGVDERDNYTSAQVGKTPKSYARFLSKAKALKGARFGIPWLSFWQYVAPEQLTVLLDMVKMIEEAGATVINGTELPHWETIVSPDGWDWDYGTTRGFSNESEYTYIKVDFYNNLQKYLAELSNTNMRNLADIMAYNIDNVITEGGTPGINPYFGSGQDGFDAAFATLGVQDQTYWEALGFCQRTTREEGIDAALRRPRGQKDLHALLVPPEVGQSYQIAAQAGYPYITVPASVDPVSGVPFGLGLVGTAFSEPTLITYASAIEDLMVSSGSDYQRARTPPQWMGYLDRGR